jgi:hypothetical protein
MCKNSVEGQTGKTVAHRWLSSHNMPHLSKLERCTVSSVVITGEKDDLIAYDETEGDGKETVISNFIVPLYRVRLEKNEQHVSG